MPSRKIPFVNGQYYHIYNRGVEKRNIFGTGRDCNHFLKTMSYYQLEGPKPRLSKFFKYQLFKPDLNKRIIDIACYCLMPNHFHFLIKQLKDNGITEFVGKLSNSYTKYFNTRNERVGPLFQGEFKSVLIESDEQLLHVSRYIHLNPLASYLVKNLNLYRWSSYGEYINGTKGLCQKEDILSFFKSRDKYKEFVLDQVDYGRSLESIKHQVLEEI